MVNIAPISVDTTTPILNSKKDSIEFLFLLIWADILFIVLHIFHAYTPYFRNIDYSMGNDRGFAEVFQYLKEYWIVLMFCGLSLVKSYTYLGWSLLFGYLLIDDSFLLHERLGQMVANYFDYEDIAMLRARDFGELTVSAMSGGIFFTMIGTAYHWGSDNFKRACQRLVMLLLLLVFFGVVVDMVHSMLKPSSGLDRLMGTLEDGGEMVVMSVICWYVLHLLRRARSLSATEAT